MWGTRSEKPSNAVKSQIAVAPSSPTTESQAQALVRSRAGTHQRHATKSPTGRVRFAAESPLSITFHDTFVSDTKCVTNVGATVSP